MRTGLSVVVAVSLLGAGGRASALEFPTDGWVPLACGKRIMTDLRGDEGGSPHERDIVGDLGAAAGFSASDASYLYLAIRLDRDPAPAGQLRPFAWGVAISTDGDSKNYEILAAVNGKTETVELYRNTATTLPDDPADPADTPPVQSFAFETHGLVEVAKTSTYGGDDDYFINMAISWNALEGLGLTPVTPVATWAGSSATPNALDGDLACHDASATAPALSGAAPAPTPLDPNQDTDGDGYPDRVEIQAGTDPNSKDSTPSGDIALGVDVEGGGGCAIPGSGASRWGSLLPLLLILSWVLSWRRTARRAGARPRRTRGSRPRS